jgi:hypothetical protein
MRTLFAPWPALTLTGLLVAACSSEPLLQSDLQVKNGALEQSGEPRPVGTIAGTPGTATTFASEQLDSIVARSAANVARRDETRIAPAPMMRPTLNLGGGAPLVSLSPLGGPTVLPSAITTGPSLDPTRSFQATATEGTPPDTMGAVGPNHVVTVVNFVVQIQNRTGTVLSRVFLDDFFSQVRPPGNFSFDPRAAYDTLSNRWIILAASLPQETATDLIAVSQTSDPTGGWFFYGVPPDPNHQHWTDMPRLGFNSKWIVDQGNEFPAVEGADFREQLLVFDKAALYAGNPAAPHTLFIVPTAGVPTPAAIFDASEQNLYTLETESVDAGGSSVVHLRRVTGPVGAETLEDLGSISAPLTSGELQDGEQPGTSSLLSFGGFTMEDVVMRNGMVYGVHCIGLPASSANHDATEWWQVDPRTRSVVQVVRQDDPTGVLDAGRPSIAVNRNNDVLIGYTRSSRYQFGSANYATRSGQDALGTMRSDTVFKAGGAPYDGGRWGDYSHVVVDPVDAVSMWTIEQFAAAPGNFNYGTWWAQVAPPTATFSRLFGDDFNDGNDVGWTKVSGAWFVISVPGGTFDYQQANNAGTRIAVAGPTATDQIIEARVKPTSVNGGAMAGILGRYQSPSAAYRLALGQDNTLQLRRHTTTGSVLLASAPINSISALPLNVFFLLRLEIRGTSLKGYVNGELLVSATDSTFASGSTGFVTVNATSEFDDIRVLSAVPEVFREGFTAGASRWTPQAGSWAIGADGNAVYTQSSTSGTTRSVAGSTLTDQVVEAVVKPIALGSGSRNVHVYARFTNSSNHYRLALTDTNQVEIRKVVGGTSTVLATQPLSGASTLQTSVWYNVRFELIGTSLKAFVDGALIASATDASLAAGQIGLGTVNASASFDDVVVRQR